MAFKIASREDWLTARLDLLAQEKAHTHAADTLAAQRRALPMVRITKPYTLTGPEGPITLPALFAGRKQLIVYHFMLGPDTKEPCSGCAFMADNLPAHLEHLHSRDTTLVLVSRAPLAQIEAVKKRLGWSYPWYSSFGSDFNYDFHVSLDAAVAPVEYNFQTKEGGPAKGEMPGLSVFMMCPKGEVFHTYSAYARGLERFLGTYELLDSTKLGRMEDKDGEPGWKLHDEYDQVESK